MTAPCPEEEPARVPGSGRCQRRLRPAPALAFLAATALHAGAFAQEGEGGLAPGEVAPDPATAQRALERTLVLQGNLLLPYRSIDFDPFVSYQHDEQTLLSPLVTTTDGQVFSSDRTLTQNTVTSGVNARIGLPWESQFEIGVPFSWQDREISQEFVPGSQSSQDESGLIGVRLGLAKTLLRERRFRPDVIGRVSYLARSDTAFRDSSGEPTRGDEITGSLSAIKRQDPLVFVGQASYTNTFEEGDIDPGDQYGFSGAVLLAASPETSLRLGLSTLIVNEAAREGVELSGTEQHIALATVGFSSVWGRGKAVNVNAGIGLTDDSPSYTLSLSVPLRVRF